MSLVETLLMAKITSDSVRTATDSRIGCMRIFAQQRPHFDRFRKWKNKRQTQYPIEIPEMVEVRTVRLR
jgi:hypothetical protein